MKQQFKGWDAVARELAEIGTESAASGWLNAGQRASVTRIAALLPHNGVLIADEVGMGKTRIATAAASAVIRAGGRVAIVVPPGLPFQWKAELADAGIKDVPLLRSLWQYTRAWDARVCEPLRPWHAQQCVVLSHAFANWRLGEQSDPWRWALLPELYAQWHLLRKQKVPYGYNQHKEYVQPVLKIAAADIARAIEASTDAKVRAHFDALFEEAVWPRALEAGAYRSDAALRPLLETAVGLGLGSFDLVIVDEAHKGRAENSVLTSLLARVIVPSSASRTLALTATPVELGVHDWKSTLKRIGVAPEQVDAHIDAYAHAVKKVRETPTDEAARKAYSAAAAAFQGALSPFLLRRDKSEDRHVGQFERHAHEPRHAYRKETEIAVDTASLSLPWRRAVCAAEALSLSARRSQTPQAKRLRLTFGNGHGIAEMLRHIALDEPGDPAGEVSEASAASDEAPTPANADSKQNDAAAQPDKRQQRATWWTGVLAAAFSGDDDPLFDHPAILAAVKEIEAVSAQDEKVLVFGRFTAPLRALTELLNARAMLRSLDGGPAWPQTTLSDREWEAAQAGHRQLQRAGELSRTELTASLRERYREIEQKRRAFRGSLLALLEAGLPEHASHPLAMKLFGAFRRTVENATQADDETSPLALVARTLQELLNTADSAPQPDTLASAFVELVDASVDRGESDDGDDGELDDDDAMELWQRIAGELNSPQGGFARLMNGETRPRTRRLLQLAFNREHSFPRVLVAQSMVGREGLNLHKACKTVVLLHPEWNPGVVEQQIGRVDRIGSLWQKSLDKAIDDRVAPERLPRIAVRPVVFKGTYDEWNWTVLRERWDDLRAQLQGIVISPRMAQDAAIAPEIVDEINRAAPRFNGTQGATQGTSDEA
ncbi:DEAD/DEAH box helicase [Paraburkholderia bannensis]|uniref:DEAD/DEAH box helicase n=1 Tax=Paraburkholderia bannensis TaxID=765414 RepID=UPI002AB7F229|nr:DEAD/DEAH box helicase [Paraburkholderia bannensis]